MCVYEHLQNAYEREALALLISIINKGVYGVDLQITAIFVDSIKSAKKLTWFDYVMKNIFLAKQPVVFSFILFRLAHTKSNCSTISPLSLSIDCLR